MQARLIFSATITESVAVNLESWVINVIGVSRISSTLVKKVASKYTHFLVGAQPAKF